MRACRWAAVAAAALGCRDPGTPASALTGSYALTAVNGRPLPAVVDTGASGFGAVLADTLVFGPDGRVTRTFVLRRVEAARAGDATSHPRLDLEYRLRGTSLRVGWFTPCPPNALCIANDSGTVSPDGAAVALTTHLYGARPRLEFARVPD